MKDAIRTAEIFCSFGSEGAARMVRAALEPETQDEIPRTQTTITTEGARLVLRISASDTVALRAAVNSYLRWVECAIEVEGLVA